MSEWIFIAQKDSLGNDLYHKQSINLDDIPEDCVAVNTLGFYKHKITLPLVSSNYFSEKDGIYIRKNIIERLLEEQYIDLTEYSLNKYNVK
jgi:hypothetical protein